MTKFPVSVFPRHIRELITQLNNSLNFHQDFLSAAVMFTVASVCGNKYKLTVKEGWEATPIFWLACVGYPGTIKTHPVKMITKPLTLIDKQNKKIYDEAMLHYDEKAVPKQKKPKFKQILISDYTVEALHQVHSHNPKGLGMYKDELNGFLNDMNKYRKGSDMEFWLESFNNGSFTVNRATKEPVIISDICINIIGTIQHQILTDIIAQYQGNGFIDRFLFTSPESNVYELNDHVVPEGITGLWGDFVKYVYQCSEYFDSEDTIHLKMSNSVFKEYKKIDRQFVTIQKDTNEGNEIKNYLSKMKTYVPRFALLLSIIDSFTKKDSVQVTDLHMQKAGLVAEYFIQSARDTFTNNKAQAEIKRLIQGMRNLTRDEQIQKLHDRGFSQTVLAETFQLSRQWIGKILRAVPEAKVISIDSAV